MPASATGRVSCCHGAHVGETLAELDRIREAEGLELVHPFDDPAVIAGQRFGRVSS